MIFDESFPVCFRITARRDIEALKRSDRRLKGKYVIVVFRKTDVGFARLLVVVSSKVGSAVMRNRLKRIVREIFRKDLKKMGSYDLMIIARKAMSEAGYGKIRDDILSLIDAIGGGHR